ncbi:MAG: TIR domain-containing protein [Magnetococcus sp. DMHC-1]
MPLMDSLHILHLSDLHFGPKGRFANKDPGRVARGLGKSVLELLEDKKPHLVIVSGDIAEAALPGEYKQALEFFQTLPGALGVERACMLFMPGNHDVSRGLCEGAAKKLEAMDNLSEPTFREAIREEKFLPYKKFLSDLMGDSQKVLIALEDIHGPLLWNFPELGLSVATLDSCVKESHRKEDHQGDLNGEQLRKILQCWEKPDPGLPLRLVALHHNPVDKMREQLGQLAKQCKVALILHGHEHANKQDPILWQQNGMTYLLAVGSLGVRPEDRTPDHPNTCRLITLTHGQMQARSLVYAPLRSLPGELEPGGWGKDPNETDFLQQQIHLSVQQPPNGEPVIEPASTPKIDASSYNNIKFLQEYRQRLGFLYDRWDLRHTGPAQAGGVHGKPIDATLDQMYLPLRFGEGYDPGKLDRGIIYFPDEILDLQNQLVICGVAGCGKTTWMRWTFRQLLKREGVFPLLLELRELAVEWGNMPNKNIRFESFLAVWVEKHGLSGWMNAILETISNSGQTHFFNQVVTPVLDSEYKFDVFLSHSKQDNSVVQKLAERLIQGGLRVWFDYWMISPGEQINKAIQMGIQNSRVFVSVLSSHSIEGKWPEYERNTVISRDPTNENKRFIFLRIDDSKIPDSLQQFYIIDYRQENEEGYEKLMKFFGQKNDQMKSMQRRGQNDDQDKKIPGLRPVLLVDGWDELGDFGHEFRGQLLGFLKVNPHIRVVVSSRPYGEGRPTHDDGFQVVDVQPLNDKEIRTLAGKFFQHCHGLDTAAGEKQTGEFMSDLENAPNAQALSRTALLLTMMLLISRSSPLPDRRHKLYQITLENLLTALPDRREKSGVRGEPHRWRPDSGEERFRVTAALAHGVQAEGYESADQGVAIVCSWDKMVAMLPGNWTASQKDGFLSWLTGPAGILVDRADNKLTFVHLSFQEFLTAWYLQATVEGDEKRIKLCLDKVGQTIWWETLRLWAALVEGANPERLCPVFRALLEDCEAGLWLAGAFLADGLLDVNDFNLWIDKSSTFLQQSWGDGTDDGLSAWRASRQKGRREALETAWQKLAMVNTNWLASVRFQMALEQGDMQKLQHFSSGKAATLLKMLEQEPISAEEFAVCRLLTIGPPDWPGWVESLLLHTWPGARRLNGFRGQNLLLIIGYDNFNNMYAVGSRLLSSLEDEKTLKFGRDLTHFLPRDLPRDWARDWARFMTCDWAHYLPSDLADNWDRSWAHYLASDWARYLVRDWAHNWARDWARGWARDLARDWEQHYLVRDMARDWARNWAQEMGLDPEQSGVLDFSKSELFSYGRMGTRALLAHHTEFLDSWKKDPSWPEVNLFHHACRLSFNQGGDPSEFIRELKQYEEMNRGEPLWPALAKHIARQSNQADRNLLEDLARHPEKRSGRLNWCLRCNIRGDLLTQEGEWLLLDDFLKGFGVSPPPYLEEMPDELVFEEDPQAAPE